MVISLLINSRSGLSIFISHIIAIAILFAVLIIVSFQMYSYYYSIRENTQNLVASSISQRISDIILGLYTTYKNSEFAPLQGKNITLSEIYLNIPEKISGNNYRISLQQHGDFWIDVDASEDSYHSERPYTSVRIETMGKPQKVYTYPIYNVVPVEVSGSVRKASKIKISYIRANENGEIRDFIIMERVL